MKRKLPFVLMAGIALLAACKGSGHYEAANYSASTADSTRKDSISLISAQPKLVKTADMSLKVKSVQQSTEAISALATKYKGMVMHNETNAENTTSNDIRISNDSVKRITSIHTSANITLKIPAELLDDFMNQVARMGIFVEKRKMDIENHTLDYMADKLKLQYRQQFIAAQKKGKITVKHPEDVMTLEDDMVDKQVTNRMIDDKVKYSTVSLNIYQSDFISTEIIPDNDPSHYRENFFQRIGFALANGWNIFADAIVGLLNFWLFILIGIFTFLVFRYFRKNNATRENLSAE